MNDIFLNHEKNSFLKIVRNNLITIWQHLTKKYITPRFTKEEQQLYREKILNIVLVGFIMFAVFALSTIVFATLYIPTYKGIKLPYFLTITFIPFVLLGLSRKGYVKIAAYGLSIAIFLGSFYGMFRWGISLPASLLFLSCTIILTGIIVTKYASIIMTIVASLMILGIEKYHLYYPPETSWKLIPTSTADGFDYITILSIITLISWLAAREIEIFVQKILLYQQKLEDERDSLEFKVRERTREIRELKSKELRDTQHMADLGKLASGIFHDLIGPLSTASMYLESIQPHTLEETKSYVIKAAGAANRMRSYLGAVQRSIKDSTHHTTFIIQDEIEHALQLLKFKSRQNNVDLEYGGDEVFLQGNPIRFFQIILNLVSNAIDACAANPNQEKNTHHKVTIRVSNTPSAIILKITDTGIGLPNTDIFERHKTHKNPSEHSGLGLWIVRTSIIDDYKGTITTSSSSQGTCFTITIPHHYSSRQ